MKQYLSLILLCASLLLVGTIEAVELSGKWQGNLEVGEQAVPIIFNVAHEKSQLTATMDSPMQGAKDIPVESVEVSDNNIIFNVKVAGARYEAKIDDGKLFGTWKQSGQSFVLNMSRGKFEQVKKRLNRPQEPQKPYPYMEKEVSFLNTKDGIRFTGTLTLPENPKAGVILISGSGPQDRDQLFMGHKTFWVLADYLSRNGIAVLRYDDRGVGASEGVFDNATSYDFANDADAAINFLAQQSELTQSKIGIIGHSEGGLIAPIVATQNSAVDFTILLAGPSRSGKFISENQMRKILRSNGVSEHTAIAGSKITKTLNDVMLEDISVPSEQFASILKSAYATQWEALSSEAKTELTKLGGGSLPEHRIKMLSGDWYRSFIKHDPVDYLTKLTIPVYALFGEKDVQVSAEDHFGIMEQSISGSKHSRAEILTGHNHLFQQSETGAMSEYQSIEETMSPTTLASITQWIHQLD